MVDNGQTMLPPARVFQWCCDSALLQIQSGAISYNQAISSAVRQLADSGLVVYTDEFGNQHLNRVQYEPKNGRRRGHVDHFDVAVRRAVVSGVNRLNQRYREQSMDYLNTDLVETTAHLGARNTGFGFVNHESWQGHVFRWKKYPQTSSGDYPDFEESCAPDDVQGIGGANCRHSFFAYVEGVMTPTYTEEQLESMKSENRPKVVFDGKEYDTYACTQAQRRLEREIRKTKRRKIAAEAAGLQEDADAAGARLRRLNQEYRDFSKAAGLRTQLERMMVEYP